MDSRLSTFSTRKKKSVSFSSFFFYLWKYAYVFLKNCALLAVVRIRNASTATDDAAALVRAVVALIAYTHQRARPHERVANHTSSITWTTRVLVFSLPLSFSLYRRRTLFAQTADGDAGLLAAEDQILPKKKKKKLKLTHNKETNVRGGAIEAKNTMRA